MDAFLNFLAHWGGAVLCLIIGAIFLVTSLADSITPEEKKIKNDPNHYLIRYPGRYEWFAILFMLAGVAASVIVGLLPMTDNPQWRVLFLIIQAAIGLFFGIYGGVKLREAMVHRLVVEGMVITIHPARGKPFETNFKEIRSVKKDSDTEDNSSSLVLRTNDREKIEVNNKMTEFRQFASQVSLLYYILFFHLIS